MLGTIVNCIAILIGSIVGLIINGRMPERVSNTIMNGLALCVIYIGISGAFKSDDTIQIIICIAVGSLIGEIIDIDKGINKFGLYIENKVKRGKRDVSIAEGFVTSSLLFCVGAMAVVGSLESGLKGNNATLFAKSILDGVSSIVFSSTLGIGVMLSIVTVFIYQGAITMCATLLSGVLSTAVVANMSAVGSLLILGLGLNVLKITNIKVANMLPALFIPIIFGLF